MALDKTDSVEALTVLHELGAINLDVMVQNAEKIRSSLAERGVYLEPGDICYKFTMHIGPKQFDLVSVAAEIERLGYRFERMR